MPVQPRALPMPLIRHWRVALAGAWAVAVGVLTLNPGDLTLEELSGMSPICLLCGDRGMADAVLNVVLFVPLGLALGGGRGAFRRAALAGLGVSLMIELLQIFTPGRHSSAADLLWNSFGAGLGALLYLVVSRRLAAPRRFGGRAWGTVLGAAFVAAGVLVVPSPTDDAYWGQWTADLGSMPEYDGTILAARLSGRSMPSRRIDAPPPHRDLLRGSWTLEGELVVGDPPRGVSPILSVYDGHQREVLLLGVHRDDLVFRERLRAHPLGFESPDLRIPGAFAGVERGDTVSIEARRVDGATCLKLGAMERCGLGITAGRTWGLLLYVEGPPEAFRQLVDFGWLLVLFAPLGFFATSRRDMVGGAAAAAAGVTIAVASTPLLAPTWLHVLGSVVGVGFGRAAVLALAFAVRGHAGSVRASMDASV